MGTDNLQQRFAPHGLHVLFRPAKSVFGKPVNRTAPTSNGHVHLPFYVVAEFEVRKTQTPRGIRKRN